MRLKSYFAASVDEAIERARLELGSEAMLLNSRRVPADQVNAGSFEVVFGITGEMLRRSTPAHAPKPQAIANPTPKPQAQPAAAVAAAAPAAAPIQVAKPQGAKQQGGKVSPSVAPEKPAKRARKKAGEKPTAQVAQVAPPSAAKPTELPALADELAALRKQIQAVQSSLGTGPAPSRTSFTGALEHSDIYRKLVDFDFSDRLARSVVEASPDTGSALAAEIDRRFQVSPRLGKGTGDRRIVMFVGPPGAGKTTTIAKLAIKLGIQRRLPVQLLSLDTMRVGGSEQLAEYARIIGVDFRALYSTAALAEVLDECVSKKLVLIDTPGYAPAEMDEAEENAYFLRRHPEIEVQLVLPASLRLSAFDKFSERFAVFNPTKLVFTHLDEVDTFGPLLEHAMNSGLPVSFLADGQSIPNDIEEASKERLTQGLFQPGERNTHGVAASGWSGSGTGWDSREDAQGNVVASVTAA